MAKWRIKNVAVRGVSLCVPKATITTAEFSFFTKEEAKLFDQTVGIKSRHIGPDTICASDLCQSAAEKLLTDLKWEKESIDILLFGSVTADFRTPPTSCLLQDRLGLAQSCFTMDIPMGCCGFMYATTVAGNLLSSGSTKRAIILVGDTAMRMGSSLDKSRAPLFGDGGTAIAMEYDPNADDILVEFESMGAGAEALSTPHGGFRNPITEESLKLHDFGNGIVRAPIHALINGMDVFSFAISKPPKSILRFIEENQIDKDNAIDYFLIHQANKMIVDRVVKKLKINPDKVPYNLEEYGNLGGASLPSLMVSRLKNQLSKGQHNLILSSFGLGLTWGTMHLSTKDLIIPDVIEI